MISSDAPPACQLFCRSEHLADSEKEGMLTNGCLVFHIHPCHKASVDAHAKSEKGGRSVVHRVEAKAEERGQLDTMLCRHFLSGTDLR